MIVPSVAGPGPLEGGPKSSPGSASEGERFSIHLNKEVDRFDPNRKPPSQESPSISTKSERKEKPFSPHGAQRKLTSSPSLKDDRPLPLTKEALPYDQRTGTEGSLLDSGENEENVDSLASPPVHGEDLHANETEGVEVVPVLLPEVVLQGEEERPEPDAPSDSGSETTEDFRSGETSTKGDPVSPFLFPSLVPPVPHQKSEVVVPLQPALSEEKSLGSLSPMADGGPSLNLEDTHEKRVEVSSEGKAGSPLPLKPQEVPPSKREAVAPSSEGPTPEAKTIPRAIPVVANRPSGLTQEEKGNSEFQDQLEGKDRRELPSSLRSGPSFSLAVPEGKPVDTLIPKGMNSTEEALSPAASVLNGLGRSGGVVPPMGGQSPGFPSVEGSKTNAALSAPPPAPPEFKPSPIDLARQIHVTLESGRSLVRLDLKPDHLGELHIALEAKGKDVSMQFRVDNDTARQVVVSGLRELSGTLTTLGWSVNDLAVNVSSGGVGNGRGDGGHSDMGSSSHNSNVLVDETGITETERAPGAWRVDLVA